MDVRERKREHAWKQIQTLTNNIKSLLIQDITKHEMNLKFSHWLTVYEQFLDSYKDYSELLSDVERTQDKVKWLIPNTQYLQSFKKSVEDWFISKSSGTHSRSSKSLS